MSVIYLEFFKRPGCSRGMASTLVPATTKVAASNLSKENIGPNIETGFIDRMTRKATVSVESRWPMDHGDWAMQEAITPTGNQTRKARPKSGPTDAQGVGLEWAASSRMQEANASSCAARHVQPRATAPDHQGNTRP